MRLPWRRGERASSLDLLVVGLGNPGREYAGHRHNVGWMVVDELARRHDGAWKGKFSGRIAEVRVDGHRVGLLKPETFMNESGRSVGAAARFYKLEADAILVVHDEIDLEPGRLQARRGGGLAGHNGLRSIAQHLKTQDFLRLRVGVGRPGRGDRRPLADYLLSDFDPEDDVEALIDRAAGGAEAASTRAVGLAGDLHPEVGIEQCVAGVGRRAQPEAALRRVAP